MLDARPSCRHRVAPGGGLPVGFGQAVRRSGCSVVAEPPGRAKALLLIAVLRAVEVAKRGGTIGAAGKAGGGRRRRLRSFGPHRK